VDSTKRVWSYLQSDTQQRKADIVDPLEREPELNYSMEALRQIQVMCDERGINLVVGIYRDVAYFDDPNRWLHYEDVVSKSLDRSGIEWFIAKSHTDQLAPRHARVTWNDPHPSAKAASLIAVDIRDALK
jgi:hypothetical protein